MATAGRYGQSVAEGRYRQDLSALKPRRMGKAKPAHRYQRMRW
jgi:hypothetical protein